MEENFQTEFALWRSGSWVYAGGSPQPREQAELHFNNRRRALATIRMPGGLEFLVDPLSAYKVQILSPHDRTPVEINPNAEADERLELLLETLGERLRDPLHTCMNELRNAQDLAQVLEALAMFCSHYLLLLSDQRGDQEEDHYEMEMLHELQITQPKREFQAKVSDQVLYAADACQTSAEVLAEIAKLGASMLTGDEDSCNTSYLIHGQCPADPTIKEGFVKDKDSKTQLPDSPVLCWQEIATLCQSANQKAVLEGNVLQWCSVKYLKECCVIQIMIDVGAFMEGDLTLSTIGISFNCPIIVEIAINELDFGQTLVAGSYRVSAYQGPRATDIGTDPSIALTYFIPNVVKQYVAKEIGTEPKQWLLVSLMKHIVYSLMFLKFNCVSCGDHHMDLGDGSFFPKPCTKNLCIALFDGWMKVTPNKITTQVNLQPCSSYTK
ncbi:unnamed protein product [Sphagnum compactum]